MAHIACDEESVRATARDGAQRLLVNLYWVWRFLLAIVILILPIPGQTTSHSRPRQRLAESNLHVNIVVIFEVIRISHRVFIITIHVILSVQLLPRHEQSLEISMMREPLNK